MPDCVVETQQHFAFDTITVPSGDTSIVADKSNDTLEFTSTDGSVIITGTAADDKIDFAAAGGTNALLDGTNHTDTVAQGVTEGSLIVGNSTPAWDELVLGADATVLRSNATTAAWGKVVLTTDVSGILPIASGGTAASSFSRTDGLVRFTGTALSTTALGITHPSANQLAVIDELKTKSASLAILNGTDGSIGVTLRTIFGGVSWIELLGQTTGNPVKISSESDTETNVGIKLQSKGTGDVELEPPGGGDTHALAGDFFVDAGGVNLTDDVVFTERADHASTPASGFGYLWTKSTAPSSLVFTDDTGVDVTLGISGEHHMPFFKDSVATAF